MTLKEIQTTAADLFFSLLDKGYLPCDNLLAIAYVDNDEVRSLVKAFTDSAGVRIIRKEKYIHMLVNPGHSVFASFLSDLKNNVKSYDSKIDLYLMGVIWLILFSEADTVMTTRINWENQGISYQQIEELTTKVLDHWKSIDEKDGGKFSKQWSLAIKDLHNKWKLLQYHKIRNGVVSYPKSTKLGVIDAAMRELEKDRMIIIRKLTQTSIVTPTVVFYERLQARFGNISKYKNRYELLKSLINEAKSTEMEVI